MTDVRSGMSWRVFVGLVAGLSEASRWRSALARIPDEVTNPEQIAALTGRYLGPT